MFIVVETSPSLPQQPTTQATGKRRFNKKLYVLIAAVAAIAVVFVALFVPQGAAIIPLEVNYTVGEKMVYSINQQITILDYSPHSGSGPPNTTISSTNTVEVTAFDGQYYTLKYTYVFTGGTPSPPANTSFTQKISKQGYTINAYQGADTTGNATANPFITGLLNRSEVRVGDTWTVPIESSNPTSSSSGNMMLTFQGFEDITVPAGTFRVFKVNSVSNVTIQTTPRTFNNATSTTTLTISQNGTMHMEYNTCRRIKSTVQQIVSTQSSSNAGNMTVPSSSYSSLQVANIELVEDILP